MVDVNSIHFNFDTNLLEISYNINEEEPGKEYNWSELALLLNRIPGEYVVLYDTGCIWNAKTEDRYVFDTFSQTPIFECDIEGASDDHIFNVITLEEVGPINCREYTDRLNALLIDYKEKDLLVEYFHLVLLKTSMIEY